jgi:short chain dehydrogenase
VANIHLYNLFMPLILKGKTKKVIVISSGLADLDLTNKFDVDLNSLYSISKAGMNMVTAKFSAQYKKDGVLFLSICPGMVEVGHFKNCMIHLFHFEHRSSYLTYLSFHSDPGAVAELGGNDGEVRSVCTSFHWPSHPGSLHPRCEVGLGKGQRRKWRWRRLRFALRE